MNKTISINIGGFVFNIEEDAYQKLYHYLNTVKKNFTEAEERDEIMNDIEARIAEIFQSKISSSKEVIVEKDVDQVIDVMGKPEDYVSEEFAGSSSESSNEKEKTADETTSSRRLFRDTENATLGGVCSGLAHYFNIDVAVIRILFVVFTLLGGSGVLIYIIMLFAVPEAKTTNDKLQMKGRAINVESIKEHFNKLKDDLTTNAKNGKFKKTFNETVNKGIKASSSAIKIFAKLIGLAFVIGGMFAFIIAVIILFGNNGLLPMSETEHVESLPTLLHLLYPGETEASIVFFSIIFAVLIPILGIIITGTRVLFNIKKTYRPVAVSSTVLWFICLGILIVTGIDLGMNMRTKVSIDYPIPYTDSSDVLFIDVSDDSKFSNHISYHDVIMHSELVKVENENVLLGYPELVVREKNDTGNFEIVLYKKSQGIANTDAIERAERIEYKITLTGNRLYLPPYFTIPKTDKLRFQQPVVEILVPKGKRVELGKNIDRISVHVNGEQNYLECPLSGTTWMAFGKQLVCKECPRNMEVYSHELH